MSEEGSKRRAFRRKTQNAARLKKQSVTLRHVRRGLKTTGFSAQNAEFGTAKKNKVLPYAMSEEGSKRLAFRRKTQNSARLKKQSVTLRHVRRGLETPDFSGQNAESSENLYFSRKIR